MGLATGILDFDTLLGYYTLRLNWAGGCCAMKLGWLLRYSTGLIYWAGGCCANQMLGYSQSLLGLVTQTALLRLATGILN